MTALAGIHAWVAARPIFGPRRLAGVDLARGLAVLGMFAAHLLAATLVWDWDAPSTWLAIVNGRSSILFATLAGVSLGVMTHGFARSTRTSDTYLAITIRAFMLAVIGILFIVSDLPVYVILTAYALLFFAVMPFLRVRVVTLAVWAAGTALVMPWPAVYIAQLDARSSEVGTVVFDYLGLEYPFFLWLAFVLAGLACARAGLQHIRVQVQVLLLGAVLAVAGYTASLVAPPLPTSVSAIWSVEPHSSGIPEVVGSGGFALAVIAASLLLCRLRAVRILTFPLRAMGSMPLTAYCAHLLVWLLMTLSLPGGASNYWDFIDTDPFWPIALGVMASCTLWSLTVGKGPLEWLIDLCVRLVVRPVHPPLLTEPAPSGGTRHAR